MEEWLRSALIEGVSTLVSIAVGMLVMFSIQYHIDMSDVAQQCNDFVAEHCTDRTFGNFAQNFTFIIKDNKVMEADRVS
jgi:hypothetical protein